MARKKKTTIEGRCYDCANAYLMQSIKENPVIAECRCTGERWVASMKPDCGGKFVRRIEEAVIHPMIYKNKH